MNTSRLVLLGGGHAHIQVLKSLRMSPLPEVEVILVSDRLEAPYSGMLPGRLAGWFEDSEMQFDLPRLCAQSGVTFIQGAVNGVDLKSRLISIEGRAPLAFDFVSVNVGIRPRQNIAVKNSERVVPLKPISELLDRWKKREHVGASRWAVIGGGAAGYEVASVLALETGHQVTLIEQGAEILAAHAGSVRRKASRALDRLGVRVLKDCAVQAIDGARVETRAGVFEFDHILLATAAEAPPWLKNAEWTLSRDGFLQVNEFLQSVSHPRVFGAGDCVQFGPEGLPKAGVYAVRQGPALIRNLRSALMSQPLRKYRPQSRFLSLLVSGDQEALLSYGPFSARGRWVWRWKERIDRQFMMNFQPRMEPMAMAEMEHNTCGGCGAKAAASLLQEVLPQIGASLKFEDAVGVPEHESLVSTIDGFRTFTKDNYFFAQVATWHALNDLFACGADPVQVNVFVNLQGRGQQAAELRELMWGVNRVLEACGASLGNAHTAEGMETALVLNIIGRARRAPWPKGGAQVGDVLILTKPLGTGASLQAWQQGHLPAREWRELMDHLLLAHQRLPEALGRLTVHACTDISGFGLAGHLCEMVEPSGLSAVLDSSQIPSLSSFDLSMEKNVSAFLSRDNRRSFLARVEGDLRRRELDLFFDPQTHGPLVFAVPAVERDQALGALRGLGFSQAAAIGEITRGGKPVQVRP